MHAGCARRGPPVAKSGGEMAVFMGGGPTTTKEDQGYIQGRESSAGPFDRGRSSGSHEVRQGECADVMLGKTPSRPLELGQLRPRELETKLLLG